MFFVPTYVIAPPFEPEVKPSLCAGNGCDSAPVAMTQGRLRVEIEPREIARIYLDGAYAGTAGSWEELDVEAGTHFIEIRAEGYHPVQDSLLVTGGRIITYKSTLKAEARADRPQAPVAERPAVRAPATYYVIPGCYAGNVRPEDAGLPATCDPTKAVSVTR